MRQLPACTAFGSANLKTLPADATPTGLAEDETCWTRVGVAAEAYPTQQSHTTTMSAKRLGAKASRSVELPSSVIEKGPALSVPDHKR